jgi:DNA-binding LacI/PurR family transcriptional regulator
MTAGGATTTQVERARSVTLFDVAREAGVAVSTASRALSNPGRVSNETRDLVQAVARRLDYRPNRMAQALPSGRSQMLALLLPDITNPHNFGLIRGAEAQARAAGYTLILGHTQESPELERSNAERLESVVDGMILASSRLPDDDLRELAARSTVALFNREIAGFPRVVTDAADGARQIVQHLAALGHRSIAYLGGPRNAWTDAERWRALSRAARSAGITITRHGPFFPTLEHGAAAADVGRASGATAFVAFNDLLAIGVLQRLEQLGVRVPEEVSVVGNDDIFGSDFCNPPLTTVTTPAERAGRALIDVLLEALNAGAERRVVLTTQLHVRASTAPPAAMSGGVRGG